MASLKTKLTVGLLYAVATAAKPSIGVAVFQDWSCSYGATSQYQSVSLNGCTQLTSSSSSSQQTSLYIQASCSNAGITYYVGPSSTCNYNNNDGVSGSSDQNVICLDTSSYTPAHSSVEIVCSGGGISTVNTIVSAVVSIMAFVFCCTCGWLLCVRMRTGRGKYQSPPLAVGQYSDPAPGYHVVPVGTAYPVNANSTANTTTTTGNTSGYPAPSAVEGGGYRLNSNNYSNNYTSASPNGAVGGYPRPTTPGGGVGGAGGYPPPSTPSAVYPPPATPAGGGGGYPRTNLVAPSQPPPAYQPTAPPSSPFVGSPPPHIPRGTPITIHTQ